MPFCTTRSSQASSLTPQEGTDMARIVAAIARALREDTTEKVHFHGGPDGPYVCENARCTSPGL